MNNAKLIDFFTNPKSVRQKQYEVVRAFVVDKLPKVTIADKFNYKLSTVSSIIRDAKTGKLNLFPEVKKGPKKRTTPFDIQKSIIDYRKKENLSSVDIHQKLTEHRAATSVKTIERILKEAGFEKLKRRTFAERGLTKRGKILPERSEKLNFNQLKPFSVDTPIAGAFFFIPYIVESGILDIVEKSKLPKSSVIDAKNACLSMLLLKLIGNERLSHMYGYDEEPGLGVFAGLNILPKSTYMSTYSCRTSNDMLLRFQKEIVEKFMEVYPQFYNSKFINLDFHSIPHFGEQSEMEKVWCGARSKAMKGANTIFAQDSESNVILYTRADILRKEEANEIKLFINYWKKMKGSVNETLVFDCKFTKYSVFDELCDKSIKFITLRKRNKSLVQGALNIPKQKWQKKKLDIPKRKHTKISVFESTVRLNGLKNDLRQIIVKDNGREKPTFILTNNYDLSLTQVLEVYAKRWHIENKLAELVSFFNMNALSSPLMIRIHFDILWTIIANTFYRKLAEDLRRFENNTANTIFKKFINMPGKVIYDGENFQVKIRKRSHTPILMGVDKLTSPFVVPWLDNKSMQIIWTP